MLSIRRDEQNAPTRIARLYLNARSDLTYFSAVFSIYTGDSSYLHSSHALQTHSSARARARPLNGVAMSRRATVFNSILPALMTDRYLPDNRLPPTGCGVRWNRKSNRRKTISTAQCNVEKAFPTISLPLVRIHTRCLSLSPLPLPPLSKTRVAKRAGNKARATGVYPRKS